MSEKYPICGGINTMKPHIWGGGETADAADLKSAGVIPRVGSNPTRPTCGFSEAHDPPHMAVTKEGSFWLLPTKHSGLIGLRPRRAALLSSNIGVIPDLL
jgi:hypothetical protein